MRIPSPEETIDRLVVLVGGISNLGRLRALQVLHKAELAQKLRCSFQFYQDIEGAIRIADFLKRSFQVKEPYVNWPDSLNPELSGVVSARQINDNRLDTSI